MRSLLLLSALLALPALAQAPPPQISPQAAYDQATKPVEIVRRSIANWSNSETASLGVAVTQAKQGCSLRPPAQFAGDDLIALMRLCSLGQQWESVRDAASLYIGSSTPPSPSTPPSTNAAAAALSPQIAQAYAYGIDASLHLDDPSTALAAARDMLRLTPYTDLTSQALGETVRYLQLIRTTDALFLLSERQPVLLAALHSSTAAAPPPSASAAGKSLAPPPAIRTLYADALALAVVQQLNMQPEAAGKTVHELEAVLPSNLSPDDGLPIADLRTQYNLLGSPLPPIPSNLSLLARGEPPRINTSYGASTVLLLFPDWCAQCVRMATELLPTVRRIGSKDIHLYGLLVAPVPSHSAHPVVPEPALASSRSPAKSTQRTAPEPVAAAPSATDLLQGTPTLVVSKDVLSTFAATDFPLLIVTDHSGIIRFLGTAPENAFVPGGLVDQVTGRVIQQWPPPLSP